MELPSNEEVREVMTEYNIHPFIAQELIGPNRRPKAELYPDFIYAVLHFPVIQKQGKKRTDGRRTIEEREIDFIIGRNFIVTSRYDGLNPLHDFAKIFEVDSVLDRDHGADHAGLIFFQMIRSLYESLEHELESVSDRIKNIEDNIFKGRERAMVIRLSETSRELLDMRRATGLHREVLRAFDEAARKFFGEAFANHSRAILGEYAKVKNVIDSNLESVAELRDTNNSLLNTRETETIKRLTIIAFFTLPASVITNFFQLTTVHTPIVGQADDWLIVMSIMFLSTLFLFAIAKLRRWF